METPENNGFQEFNPKDFLHEWDLEEFDLAKNLLIDLALSGYLK